MDKIAVKTYRDLVVWQKSMDLVVAVYELTDQFPKSEMYGLTSQMKRAAVSIPSNVAEGRRRGSRKDFRNFILTAFGSGSELETQIEISKRLPFSSKLDYHRADTLLDGVMRMLNRLAASLQATS